MADFDYDVVIIGSGPGGYVAAIRAAQLGLKPVVIEKDRIGGVCLNIGCIPSKALIHSAEVYNSIPELEEMGIKLDINGFSYKKVFERSRKVSETLSKGIEFSFKKHGIDYIISKAVINGKNEVLLEDGKKITGRFLLIATGSSPGSIPGFEIDEKTIISSTGALMLKELPESIVILGGGVIGIEFAHIFNSFGVNVTIVELLDEILPTEDLDSVKMMKRVFKKRKIDIHTSTKATGIEIKNSKVVIKVESSGEGAIKEIEAEKALIAVGRIPNTIGIGLENIGIKTEKDFIPIGDYYQTKIDGVYAIGDIVDTPLLAHVASEEGIIAVENMAKKETRKKIDIDTVPSAIYCEPQIASFGYTQKRAEDEGVAFETRTFQYAGVGKSIAIGRPEGIVKIIFSPDSHEILGAHITGKDATELIHEVLLAKNAELLPDDIAKMMHAHPTLSELNMEAMRMVDGWNIHL